MRIIITGTPGTGKTKIAGELSKKTGYELIDLKKIVREEKLLGTGRTVDVKKLGNKVRKRIKGKKDFVLEGHLACEFSIPCEYLIVLRTHPDTLRKRMKKRKYGKKKIEENLFAEMLDYCSQTAQRNYKKTPVEIDTTRRKPAETIKEIIGVIKKRKKKLDKVDFTKELKEHLGLI